MSLLRWGLVLLLFAGCSTSFQNQVVHERLADYQRASKNYHAAEEVYLTLLFNLERYPDDPYLLEEKKIEMKELANLRAVMLQSRTELDEVVQQWELQIRTARSAQKNSRLDSTTVRQEN